MEVRVQGNQGISNPAVKVGQNIAVQTGKDLPQSPAAQPVAPAQQTVSTAAEVRPVETQKTQQVATPDISEKIVETLNAYLKDNARELQFQIEGDIGKTVVKVIHPDSGEVIRQLPNEVVVRLAEAFAQGNTQLLDDFA